MATAHPARHGATRPTTHRLSLLLLLWFLALIHGNAHADACPEDKECSSLLVRATYSVGWIGGSVPCYGPYYSEGEAFECGYGTFATFFAACEGFGLDHVDSEWKSEDFSDGVSKNLHKKTTT